ncbi:MAG: hypothetical protein IKY34_07075 [Ruminiclostridium sp.]|nr:hypothetical protein [Ruminiclostridium sp.]
MTEKKKTCVLTVLLLSFLLLALAACGSVPENRVFQLDPDEVTSIAIQKMETWATFEDPKDIAPLVEELNRVEYLSEELIPAGAGWTYRLILETEEGRLDLTFGDQYILMDSEKEDYYRYYTLPEGSMQTFIDYVE